MTNKEWLATLSDDQIVSFIYDEHSDIVYPTAFEVGVDHINSLLRMKNWLNEEHKEKL